ncbi:hypothetical protein NEFER03_0398 [Nematocida sp. LUAm3]|nr:hypothetical protein NEFER03_0398 [Nematocida sp. LUAm3]KAI5175986.1 hypothetical protein NEFER02_1832 [Nematocida sp. LUAm2]KAI5179082.1 hypothetical protein NEFER01_1949 [Nematocida sp. LUAm1]
MEILLRREAAEEPIGVSAMAVSEKYVVVARTEVLEVYTRDMVLLWRIDVGARDIESIAVDKEEVLIASLEKGLIRVRLSDLSVSREGEGLWRVYQEMGRVMRIYSCSYGGSEVYLDEEMLAYSKYEVLSAGIGEGSVAYADTRGVLTIKSAVNREIHLEGSPTVTGILHVFSGEYAISTMNGEVHIIDSNIPYTKEIIKVRESSINCMALLDGKIFLSGADSRLLSLRRTASGKWIKYSQDDTHISDVFALVAHNGKIYSAGDDGAINVHLLSEGNRVKFFKRFFCNSSGIGNHNNENIFFIQKKNTIKLLGKEKVLMIHKVKYPLLDLLGYKNCSVIRNKLGIFIYKYNINNPEVQLEDKLLGVFLLIEIIEDTLYAVGRENNKLFLVEYFLPLKTKRIIYFSDIKLDYLPYRVSKQNNNLILIGEKLSIINLNNYLKTEIQIPSQIHLALSNSSYIYICHKKKEHESTLQDKITITRRVISNTEHSVDRNTEHVTEHAVERDAWSDIEVDASFLTGGILKDDMLILQTQKKIIKVSLREVSSKYFSFGGVLHSLYEENNKIFGIHTPWRFIKQKMPLQVYKERYGRK